MIVIMIPRVDLKDLLENNQIDSCHFDLEQLGVESIIIKKNILRVQLGNQELDLAPIFSHNQTGGGSTK